MLKRETGRGENGRNRKIEGEKKGFKRNENSRGRGGEGKWKEKRNERNKEWGRGGGVKEE